MRSLAERANLLATLSGFWKRELLGAKPIAVCSLRGPSRTARDPRRVTSNTEVVPGQKSAWGKRSVIERLAAFVSAKPVYG
jgi:hypothetical protein